MYILPYFLDSNMRFLLLVLQGGLFEGALRSRTHSNPQAAVNSYEVSPFNPAFFTWLATGHGNSPPQIDQPIVYNLTTIFAQSLLHLTTNFAATKNSNLAYRNPTPALQKLVVISSN